MKLPKFALLLSHVFFIFTIYSQPLSSYDDRINYFWDFYSNNRMSTNNAGKGYSGVAGDNDIAGIILNPASMDIKNKIEVHAEYVNKTNKAIPLWYIGEYKPILKQFHPALLIGGAYKFNEYLQAGLLFYNSNTQTFDNGEIIQTNDSGRIIGKYDSYINTSISTINLPVVFNYKNKLKVGISLQFSFFHGYEYLSPPIGSFSGDGKSNFNKFNIQAGVIYSPFKEFSIGVNFIPEIKQNVVWAFGGALNDSFQTPNVFPMKIAAGIEYRFKKIPIMLDLDYNYVNSSKQSGLKDRNDINFGAEYNVNKALALRAGFFTNKDYRSGNSYNQPNYDEYFITVGASYNINKFKVSLAVMDSHVSAGLIKQTLINGGVTGDF